MQEKHVALLVEDELELAKQLGLTFKILGHDYVHVTNQEEALEKLATQRFCYVLLDLQIKPTADSITADALAGHLLIRKIREGLPPPVARNCDVLQILVMSGNAVDTDNVRKALLIGANDFLTKPLSGNVPSIDDRIREALERSGRGDHSKCKLMVVEPKPAPVVSKPIRLGITGRLDDARTVVTIDDKPVPIQTAQLRLLLRLVRARMEGAAWVSKKGADGLGEKNDSVYRSVSRLKDDLKQFLPEAVENDRKGSYRLAPRLVVDVLDASAFKTHPSIEVQREVKKIVEVSKRDGRSISDTESGV